MVTDAFRDAMEHQEPDDVVTHQWCMRHEVHMDDPGHEYEQECEQYLRPSTRLEDAEVIRRLANEDAMLDIEDPPVEQEEDTVISLLRTISQRLGHIEEMLERQQQRAPLGMQRT